MNAISFTAQLRTPYDAQTLNKLGRYCEQRNMRLSVVIDPEKGRHLFTISGEDVAVKEIIDYLKSVKDKLG